MLRRLVLHSKMRWAVVPTLAAVTVAAVATAGPASGQTQEGAAEPYIPARYTSQVLDWHLCAEGELPPSSRDGVDELECASYRTPLDWGTPDARLDITIAVSRLPSTGATTDSLLINPGGPGAPGRTYAAKVYHRDRVREHHEVIGFDVRGTGGSDNVTCAGGIGTEFQFDMRDRSAGNLDAILDHVEGTVDDCHQLSGDFGPLVNQFQTTHDLNLLRVLLHRDKIDWLGFSAGTWLGAHFAQRFPEHVDKVVLDSVGDLTLSLHESWDQQPLGFERRWRTDFLPWLAKYHTQYGYGRTAEAARLTYEKVRAALAEEPVVLDGLPLGPSQYDWDIDGGLYWKGYFADTADYMAAVKILVDQRSTAGEKAAARTTAEKVVAKRDGGPRGPRPLVAGDYPTAAYDDAYDASFWHYSCNDGPITGDRQSQIESSTTQGTRYPKVGWSWVALPCIFWNNRPAEQQELNGEGVPPVLMVQSERDPATPIEGARNAHKAFKGSRMVTITNDGNHGIYASDNTCANNVVEDYLVGGVVPADRTCPGTPLPTP
ncbi:alpha/beta hydrolase [Kribbella albertanoniae]|nr:alpha/beta hydrolase [Kribbella albertanoniae]